MKYELFKKYIKKVSDRLKKIKKENVIRLISHHDADGICAASLMILALEKEGFKYSLSIIKQLSEKTLKELSEEQEKVYIFSDLGSGQYELIKKYLGEKVIFILDHHSFDIKILNDIPDNISMINPHSFEIDGSYEISGAGVVYLFIESLDSSNKEFSYLALVGALGDIQEKKGFSALNKEILETAVKQKKVKVIKGLRWFGLETKSLSYLLTYGADIFIPGVTGSESNAIQFLIENRIEPKKNNKWSRFNDLTEEEKKRFISSIVMKRSKEKKPEDILGDRYLLLQEPESSPLRDLKEFSTLINACGRLEKASLGIGVCLNNEESKKKAIQLLDDYKKEIITGLRWYENKDNKDIIKEKNYIIINAKTNVLSTIIGTVASIISNSTELKKGTFILAMARENDETTKASLRICGREEKVDLREIVKEITEEIGGESGGHINAAGAIISSKIEKEFIEKAIKIFEKNTN